MSTASQSPNTAEIILPPGYTLEQYLTLQGHVVTIAITVSVAFGIVAWDYFVLLPDEIALYRTKDKSLWRSPTTWAFVLLRYSGILATLPSIFFSAVQIDHCQVAVILSQVGAVLAVASSGIIFCFRIFAIWSGNKVVYALVLFMYTVMLGCWIAVATRYNAITGPATNFGSNCQMQDIVSWAPISFASSVAFDTVVLLLTLAKLRPNMKMSKSRVGRQVFRDTLMYFSITTVTNITVLSIQSLGDGSSIIKPNAVPFSTLMIVTMGSRVYLNLKLLEQRRRREEGFPSIMPLSSQGSSSMSRERFRAGQEKSLDTSFGGLSTCASPLPAPYSLPDTSTPAPYVAAFPMPRPPQFYKSVQAPRSSDSVSLKFNNV